MAKKVSNASSKKNNYTFKKVAENLYLLKGTADTTHWSREAASKSAEALKPKTAYSLNAG